MYAGAQNGDIYHDLIRDKSLTLCGLTVVVHAVLEKPVGGAPLHLIIDKPDGSRLCKN